MNTDKIKIINDLKKKYDFIIAETKEAVMRAGNLYVANYANLIKEIFAENGIVVIKSDEDIEKATRVKVCGIEGILKIDFNVSSLWMYSPLDVIKFYPITKTGKVSMVSKNQCVYNLKRTLKDYGFDKDIPNSVYWYELEAFAKAVEKI